MEFVRPQVARRRDTVAVSSEIQRAVGSISARVSGRACAALVPLGGSICQS